MFNLRLFSIRCHLLAFRYIRPEGKVGSAMDAAYMDAGRITTVGLSSYISDQTEVTNEFSGARFIKALKSVKLERGKTGKIHFNATGQRIGYKLDLYRHGGEKMYQRIAEWGLNGTDAAERLNQTVPDDGALIKAKFDIFPETVYVVVVIEKPFVMKKASVNGDKFEGFTVDLLESLSKSLKFNYKIYVSPNQYGVRKDDGTWDGMVGEIKNGNATLAMGAISITSKREIAIDFSLGILTTGVNILISRPDDHYTIFQFLKPFSLELWMTILGSFVVVSMVYFLLDYKRPSTKFTARETLWFSMGTLLKRGTDFSPEPISQRILTSGFSFFVLITVATYTANMAAFLTTKDFGKTVDSFESLADNDDISCGTVKNSATKHFLQMGTKPVFKRLWNKMIYSDGLVANSSEGEKKVASGNYAFVFDHLINSYAEGEYCNMKVVATPILMQEHGIGMKEGALFKTSINIELLKLKENGQIQDWKKKWWEDKRKCDKDGRNKKKPRGQFGVAHMAGVFIFALFGMACGVAFFLFKKFYLLAKPISVGTKEENKEGEDENGEGEEERGGKEAEDVRIDDAFDESPGPSIKYEQETTVSE
ncbi:glutamate receptor ionotropic, kainate 4 [Patella vulgata]|uniref:glutamate receptor ionotropic, kainate 4 n=1 Tax=Patella vulgata TaxID=6465 RepID=UPI00217FF7E6|nr:glutamate receptor ionotropic, kainate 4 [Patella vulgata]